MEKKAFLVKKATNFTNFINSLEPDEFVKNLLLSFTPEQAPTMLGIAVTYLKMNGVPKITNDIIAHCSNIKPESISRIGKYLEMFIDFHDNYKWN